MLAGQDFMRATTPKDKFDAELMFRPVPRLLTFLLVFSAVLAGTAAHAAPRWEAYAGQPFGVGSVTVDVDRDQPTLPAGDQRFTVTGFEGRVLYPVLKEAPVRRLLRRLLEIETPAAVTIYFLFQGDQPLELKAYAPSEQAVSITPRHNRRAHQRLLDQWWSETTGRWNRLQRDPEYPLVVENFLVATFARRLGRAVPEPPVRLLPWRKKQQETFWDELFVNERYLLRIDRELLRGAKQPTDDPREPPPPPGTRQPAGGHPLPNPIAWSPPSYPAISREGGREETPFAALSLDEVPVEPIATHVPQECFYIRFGTFRNYLWFSDLSKKWQGDLRNMLSRRGIEQGASARVQQQLSLRETALAKILGPQVIADVALVGLDPYLAQGAAIGILFQARNNFLLSRDLVSKRREALKKFPDATETNRTIADHEVSLIANPGGQVRSYYAREGDFHLVTTSRSLVERFYRAAGKDRSLAVSDGFRHVRRHFPLDRNDTIFAYVSSEFFQQLCSPALRIQCLRRSRRQRESKLLELARFAANAEGVPSRERTDLIRAGLLPIGFGHHREEGPSGEDETAGEDATGEAGSLRGGDISQRSQALSRIDGNEPLADREEIQHVSDEEIAAFRKFSAKFREEVGQLPPMAVGIRRVTQPEGGDETMIADLLVPYTTGFKWGSWADNLGQPSDQQLAPVEGDVGAVEVVLDIPVPLIGGEKQAHHLFGALRDYRSPLAIRRDKLVPDAAMPELVRGYLGAWPRPGVLELLGAQTGVAEPGPRQVGDQVWQEQRDPFLLLSFKPEVIEQVLPQLALEPAPRPAQIRLRVDSLNDKQLAETINALGYMRTRETSQAGSRLMNTLANQLHVPRPDCREVGEKLVDGKFICPLGGEYRLFEVPGGLPVWGSTGLTEANRFLLAAVPEDFQLPLLAWFRGLRGEVHMADQEMTVHLEVDMAATAVP
jgi:hypothetical protein